MGISQDASPGRRFPNRALMVRINRNRKPAKTTTEKQPPTHITRKTSAHAASPTCCLEYYNRLLSFHSLLCDKAHLRLWVEGGVGGGWQVALCCPVLERSYGQKRARATSWPRASVEHSFLIALSLSFLPRWSTKKMLHSKGFVNIWFVEIIVQ